MMAYADVTPFGPVSPPVECALWTAGFRTAGFFGTEAARAGRRAAVPFATGRFTPFAWWTLFARGAAWTGWAIM
jgi:hypothetical protein